MISLGGNIGIGLTVRLHNQFSAQARAISNDFTALYGNAQRVLRNNLQAAQTLGGGAALGGALITKGFWGATKDAMKFNYTMTGVEAVTNQSAEAVAILKKEMMALNIQSIYGAQQLGEAALELTKSGFSLKDARDAMKGVTQFGAAGDMTQLGGKEGAAGIMAHTLNTFALAATDAERAADVMAYTANKSSVDLHDLAASINYVGSTASILKIPLEHVSAMLGTLGNAGIKGTSAGVALSNMLSYLSMAATEFRTKKQGTMLEALGIDPNSILTAKGDLKEMVDIVDIFRVSMAKKTTVEQEAIARGLLNIRGEKAFVKLFDKPQIGKGFRDFQAAIYGEAKGTSARIAKMKIDTPFGRMEVMESTMENIRILIGDHLIPLTDKFVKFLIWGFNKMENILKGPFGKVFTIMAAGMALAVTVGGGLIFAMSTMRLLTMGLGISAANMGRSLVWAWTSATAAAMRYGAVAKGATAFGGGVIGKVPTYIPGKGFTGGGGAAAIGGIRGFISSLFKGQGILGRVFSIFGRLTGVVGIAIAVFGMIVGWKNIIKGVMYGLGTFVQAIFWVVDYIKNFFSAGPLDAATIASNNFRDRNDRLREAMGFEKLAIENVARRDPSKVNKFENTEGLQEKMVAALERGRLKNQRDSTAAAVYLDSRKVGEVSADKALQYLESSSITPD